MGVGDSPPAPCLPPHSAGSEKHMLRGGVSGTGGAGAGELWRQRVATATRSERAWCIGSHASRWLPWQSCVALHCSKINKSNYNCFLKYKMAFQHGQGCVGKMKIRARITTRGKCVNPCVHHMFLQDVTVLCARHPVQRCLR